MVFRGLQGFRLEATENLLDALIEMVPAPLISALSQTPFLRRELFYP